MSNHIKGEMCTGLQPAEKRPRLNGEAQLASAVLMVEPSKFCSNEETKVDNKFMGAAEKGIAKGKE